MQQHWPTGTLAVAMLALLAAACDSAGGEANGPGMDPAPAVTTTPVMRAPVPTMTTAIPANDSVAPAPADQLVTPMTPSMMAVSPPATVDAGPAVPASADAATTPPPTSPMPDAGVSPCLGKLPGATCAPSTCDGQVRVRFRCDLAGACVAARTQCDDGCRAGACRDD